MKTFINVAQMKLATLQADQFVETGGYYTKGDVGAARYLVVVAQAADGYGDHTLANGNVAVLQVSDDTIQSKCYGLIGDGVTNDMEALKAAAASGYRVDLGEYSYYIGQSSDDDIVVFSNSLIGNGALIKHDFFGVPVLAFVSLDGVSLTGVNFEYTGSTLPLSAWPYYGFTLFCQKVGFVPDYAYNDAIIWRATVSFVGCINVNVDRVEFFSNTPRSQCLMFLKPSATTYNKNITITNVLFDNYIFGVNSTQFDNLVMDRIISKRYYNIPPSAYGHILYISLDGSPSVSRNVSITNVFDSGESDVDMADAYEHSLKLVNSENVVIENIISYRPHGILDIFSCRKVQGTNLKSYRGSATATNYGIMGLRFALSSYNPWVDGRNVNEDIDLNGVYISKSDSTQQDRCFNIESGSERLNIEGVFERDFGAGGPLKYEAANSVLKGHFIVSNGANNSILMDINNGCNGNRIYLTTDFDGDGEYLRIAAGGNGVNTPNDIRLNNLRGLSVINTNDERATINTEGVYSQVRTSAGFPNVTHDFDIIIDGTFLVIVEVTDDGGTQVLQSVDLVNSRIGLTTNIATSADTVNFSALSTSFNAGVLTVNVTSGGATPTIVATTTRIGAGRR